MLQIVKAYPPQACAECLVKDSPCDAVVVNRLADLVVKDQGVSVFSAIVLPILSCLFSLTSRALSGFL